MTLRITLLLSALLLAACAAPRQEEASLSDAVTCTKETPVGSAIPVTRCRTAAEIEQARSDAQKVRDAVRSSASPPGGTKAGP